MSIPTPPSKDSNEEGNPDANCPEYKPIMGNYCEFFVTRTGECIKGVGKCDGFGVLK
ncbi:MAG: hypothetical protein K9W45_05895 [Candidatus Heimdallarchaeum aukensis]|uniref:Uncharacterized protein n=1 Tax=Candidatus Heimdallarchaeum aukensis TaxID=2876573 RepID=A0A9Y1FMF6_9ARCH|nr:MAG: hypothetical protein K9W45_05895 [Candidatus Heimdallarchaeum aukensis]